jgi:hypothetical protein
MQVVYIVKSFGPKNGYMNLKAFADHEDAAAYARVVDKQIPRRITNEFVEIEELVVDYG